MIQHLNTEFMAKDKDRYIFYFSRLHKSWRKGQAPPAITYFAFGDDKALCVAVETLNEYINHSKPWRESNHEKQLFLSSIRPHNAVVSCTISGWLKKRPLNRLELILIYLRLIQQDLLQVQKPVWVGRL